MDKINPKDVDFIRNASHTGAAGNLGKEAKKAEEVQEPEDSVILGKIGDISYTREDLTPDGKLPIIIRADDPDKLQQLKKNCVKEHPHNKIKADLPIINAFAAEIDPKKSKFLSPKAELKNVQIFLDGKVRIPEPIFEEKGVVHPKLDVATKTLNMDKVWEKGYTGKGVSIAVIDTGIAPHPDVKDRIIAFNDIVNNKTEPYDDQGHGTHVAGDAAGSGKASQGKYKGPAYEANLVGVKVLDGNGSGTFSDVIKGIQWATENKEKYNIRVINMSLGGRASGSYKDDPVAQAVEAAVKKGIVTVVAAGNSGPGAKTIGTPAHDPLALTIGALDDRGTPDPSDDKIAYFSSRGPTKYDNLSKPDVVSPGVNITAPNAGNDGYTSLSGTSMASPIAAGVVAALIQASPKVTPDEVKAALAKTADKMPDYDANTQGAGVIDPYKALQELTKSQS